MNLRKSIFIIFLICIVFLSHSFGKDVIRLSNGEWKPYLSEDLKHYGVASHIVSEAFALENIDVKFVWFQESWKRAYHEAKIGKVDGTLVWSKKAEREAEMYYSDVIIAGKTNVFFHLKETRFDWKTMNDLKGMMLGGTLGYTYGKAFDDAEKKGLFQVVRVRDESLNFKILLRKRIIAFVSEVKAGTDMLNKLYLPEEIAQITYHPKPVRIATYHLLLNKKNPLNKQVMARFDRGLAKLKQQGTYDLYLAASKKGKYSKDYVPEPEEKITKPELEKKPAEPETVEVPSVPKMDQAVLMELIKKHRKRMLLLEGSKGQEVEELQNALKNKGFYDGPIDGNFNANLTEVVKKFQKSVGISVDGVVGPITRKYIGYSY